MNPLHGKPSENPWATGLRCYVLYPFCRYPVTEQDRVTEQVATPKRPLRCGVTTTTTLFRRIQGSKSWVNSHPESQLLSPVQELALVELILKLDQWRHPMKSVHL